jgi:ABC-type multidrug transport system ATPase subunit
MTINIPAYKYIQNEQNINFSNGNICTLIGENGSGKSTILESIFNKYIEEDGKKVICFTSGQNELFYSIFDKHKQQSNKFKPDENNIINSFYFDYWWVRFLVFFSITLKRNGKVKQYFDEKNYDFSSLSIDFKFRVKQSYINQIKNELERESKGEFAIESKRRTIHYNLLLKLINKKINPNYDFDEINNNIVKRTLSLNITEARNIFGNEANKIFTFLSHATMGWLSNIDIESCDLYLQQNSEELEFEQLSDGEYQLLSIYALIDLFDSENTIFLFDEVDSHLHFNNISKLWNILKTISGKVITTTHISESVLNNDFNSISYIEKGKIVNDLVPKKVLEKISNVVNQEKFIYQICSKLENIVLIDDESDWEIFKELAKIKIGEDAITLLKDIVAIKETSSYNSDFQLFGNEKIEFTKNIKTYSISNTINLKNIFMICDLDEYQIANINDNHQCIITDKLRTSINKIQKFNHNQTKAYLLSWKRREILHYMISYSMLKEYNKLEELKNIANYIDGDEYINNNFDSDSNIRTTSKANVKFIKQLMCKENGDVDADNWTDYDKLKQIISKIPANEISDDIVKMYEFIKSKVENN